MGRQELSRLQLKERTTGQPGLTGGDHRTLHTFSSSMPGRNFFPNCEGKGILWWIDEFLVLQCTLSLFFSQGTGGKKRPKKQVWFLMSVPSDLPMLLTYNFHNFKGTSDCAASPQEHLKGRYTWAHGSQIQHCSAGLLVLSFDPLLSARCRSN